MKFSRSAEIKIKEMVEEYGLPEEVIRKIIKSPYEFIRKKTKELPIKNGMTKEEFLSLKSNFNVPGLFKMHTSWHAYSEIQKKINNK